MRDVTGWSLVGPSTGSKHGYWLQDPATGRAALVKQPKPRKPKDGPAFVEGEVLGEYLACKVGSLVNVVTSEVEIVIFQGQACPLVWSFLPKGYRLAEGTELTNTQERKVQLTLGEVRRTLAGVLGDNFARRFVVEMACFDILIGNSDRHQQNWGVLQPDEVGLEPLAAPLFDHGGAFGSSQAPERLTSMLVNPAGLDVFERGFRYELATDVRGGGRARIEEVLDVLREWDPELAGFPTRVESCHPDVIESILATVPDQAAPKARRDFAGKVLASRRSLFLKGGKS